MSFQLPTVRRIAALLFALSACATSWSVILGGNTAVQTGAPADDPGWANVVSVNGSSGVYLGNGWVLTAAHVGAAPVEVGGFVHFVQPGAALRLRTADGAGETDLVMFRLATQPALPAVQVIDSVLPEDSDVTMIGFGRQRGAAVSYDANWILGGTPTAFSGFLWSGGGKGWGTNRTSGTIAINYGFGDVFTYVTDFTAGAGATADEAQAAANDSGGAVFAKVGGAWRLAGTMVAIETKDEQPGDVAVFGNLTYSVELSTMRPQIEALRGLSTPYAIWQYDRFRATPTDALADSDADGFTNLKEYAFGMNPLVADAASAPQVSLVNYSNGSALTATYTHNTEATDVTCVVEVSSDLVNWSSGPGATELLSTTALGGNREQLVVRDAIDTTASPRRFLRVRVTRVE